MFSHNHIGVIGQMPHQIQYSYLHLALVQICRFVLDNLDSDDIVRPEVLTFDNLTKGPLTENIEDQVPARQLALALSR